jgi:hypothetical protein
MLHVAKSPGFDFVSQLSQLAAGMFFEKSEVAQLGKRE